MKTEQAIRDIRATGIFVGWRRRRAISALARMHDLDGILILADALSNGHPDAKLIASILERLSTKKDNELVETLWRAWVENPKPALAIVLSHIGWPEERPIAYNIAISVLMLITNQQVPKEILAAVECLAHALPKHNETLNDNLYTAWVNSQSKVLERIIDEQGRQPGNLALEALYALATAQLDRYAALEDTDTDLLSQAIRIAPTTLLERVSNAIATSENKQLLLAYRIALSQTKLDTDLHLQQLKLVGDEVGLFEQIAKLRLEQALELCDRWNSIANDWAISSSQKVALERILPAYRKLIMPTQNPELALPKGVVDIFDYWRTGQRNRVSSVFKPDDPINITRALYLNSINKCDIKSNHWLERLVARSANSVNLKNSNDDKVYWVVICVNEIKLLQTQIVGTPIEYLYHKDLLEQARQSTRTYTIGLLEILCALQNTFIGTDIVVETLLEPAERNAIRVEDYKV